MEDILEDKTVGGLGIPDLHAHNKAFQIKRGWEIRNKNKDWSMLSMIDHAFRASGERFLAFNSRNLETWQNGYFL